MSSAVLAEQPVAFTNINPDYYRTTITDDIQITPYRKRTLIYATVDNLIIGQIPGTGTWIEQIPAGANLTVQAINLAVVGPITLPRGDIQIYCKTLTVPKGYAAVLDVSAEADDMADKNAFKPTPVMDSSNPATDGTNGAEIAELWAGEIASGATGPDEYGGPQDYPFGMNGEPGGSITIICDVLQLDDTLVLKANGRNGYTGCSGQQGGANSDSHGTAGQGGDAQAGGDGGDAGAVTIKYRSISDATKLSTIAAGGKGGQPGEPGKGGASNGALGNNAPQGMDGIEGSPLTLPYTDLNEFGAACDEIFMLKAVQKARLLYLLGMPEGYDRHWVPSDSQRKNWQVLTDYMKWIQSSLKQYAKLDDAATLSDLRKQNLYSIITTYVVRAANSLTYFGGLYNSIPGMVLPPPYTAQALIDKYGGTFKELMSTRKTFEKAFAALATAEDQEQTLKDNIEQLEHAMRLYAVQYSALLDLISPSSDLVAQLNKAAKTLSDAQAELNKQLQALDSDNGAVANHFGCDVDNIMRSLPQMAFVVDNPLGLGVMTGAIAGGAIYDGLTKIADNTGRQISKDALLMDIKMLDGSSGGDLISGVRGAIFSADGTLNPNAATVIARLDSLDDEIRSFSDALGSQVTERVTRAIENARAALIERGRLQMMFMSYAGATVNAYNRYEQTKDELKKAQGTVDPVSPEMVGIVSHYAALYQDQLESALEFVVQVHRQYAYYTLSEDMGSSTASMGTTLSSLWSSGITPSPTDVESLNSRIDTIVANLADHFTKSTSPAADLPPEGSKQRGVLHADITDPGLLQAFKSDASITVHIIPEGQTATYMSKAKTGKGWPRDSNGNVLIEAPDTDQYWDIRVTAVQPRVFGAINTRIPEASHPVIALNVKASAAKNILDASGTTYEFSYLGPRWTNFRHFLKTLPDDITQDDIAGDDGTLVDSYLDALGMFGVWTVKVVPAQKGDVNDGLDLSGVTQIRIYFIAKARSKGIALAKK